MSARYPTLAAAVMAGTAKDRGVRFREPDGERAMSYAELASEVRRVARVLLDRGLRPGDRLGMLVSDNRDFLTGFLGAICGGVVPVPMYPPLMLGGLDVYVQSAARILVNAEARGVFASRALVPLVADIAGRVPSIDVVLEAEECSYCPPDLALPDVQPDHLAFLQFTSGTTSAPKGVMVTHRALMANASALAFDVLRVDPRRDWGVSWLPMYHDMGLIGMTIVPLIMQASMWFLPPLTFLKAPTSWIEAIHEVGASISFAPNFAYSLVTRRATEAQLGRWNLSRWRVAGCGAELINPKTLVAFQEKLARCGFRPSAFLPCYGMAEATLAITMTPVDEGMTTIPIDRARLAETGTAVRATEPASALELVSCGCPLPGHEVWIVDDAGTDVPEGHVGEITVRGPSITTGYFEDPVATASTFRNGWLHTGDLGFIRDGLLYVSGRQKELIILNGRNYHPEPIEWAAAEVEGVRRGAVVAFSRVGADGEQLVIALESSNETAEETLPRRVAKKIRGDLGLHVSDVFIVPPRSIPKTTSGKLRRNHARALYLGALAARGQDGQPPSVVR